MFEAQLGALRDIDYGIYPYTTSSNTIGAYAPIGAGIPGRKLNKSIGIMKAYSSCVGDGPFTTELAMTEEEDIADVSAEHFLEVLAPVPHIVHADRLLVINVDHGQVLGFHQGFQALAHTGIHVDQIAHAQGFLHVLITIGVSNAALGGTKLCARFGKAGLLQAILLHMPATRNQSATRQAERKRLYIPPVRLPSGQKFLLYEPAH